MDSSKKISQAVIRRLPRYYRYLKDLYREGISRVSSKELSERMHITASQIRQDLNCFGGFGQQGYGYSVEALFKEIESILGLDTRYKLILIGAGNIGSALAKYENLSTRGFDLCAIFDVKEELIGKQLNDLMVQHIDNLKNYVMNNEVDIAILAVPHSATAKLAELVVGLGIKAIWNYSPSDLHFSHDVVIENVHLVDSLMVLGYNLKEKLKSID
jgi:redox-sensing transcriptional repressor